MTLGGSTRDVPDLLKPFLEFDLGDSAFSPLLEAGRSITSWFPLHQDEFHVVLDDRIRLVRFPQKLGPVLDFIGRIGDFVPDNGIEVVETNFAAEDADVRMEWKDEVSAEASTRYAYVSYNTHETSAGNQNSVNVKPNLFQLFEKGFVVIHMAKLAGILVVTLQIPVRWRCDDKMNGLVWEEREISCVAID
jgi:hypothetical protein